MNFLSLSGILCSGKHIFGGSHHSHTLHTFYTGHRQDQNFPLFEDQTMSHFNWEADKMYQNLSLFELGTFFFFFFFFFPFFFFFLS